MSERKRKRPKPPPPPPASLVRLLKTDPNVLEYFQSLQANLEADVNVWKRRAKQYQSQYEKLKKKKKNGASKKTNNRRTTAADDDGGEAARTAVVDVAGNQENQKETGGIEIEDHMFELSSDEESENHGGAAEVEDDAEEELTTALVKVLEQQRKSLVDEVNETLRLLGVALVDVKVVGDSADDEGGESVVEEQPKSVSVRRSNEQIAASLFYSIHQLSHVNNTDHGPFDPVTCFPILESTTSSHPAIRAHSLLVRALVILDSIQTDELDHRDFVEQFVQSLYGEIQQQWACHDRAQLKTALVFSSDDSSMVVERSHEDDRHVVGASSKSRTRLYGMLERYWLSQIVTSMLVSRNDTESMVRLVLEYVASTIPTVNEDCPKLPPILSFVVLRGLMMAPCCELDVETDWFASYLEDRSLLCNVLGICFYYTSSIFKIRSTSTNDRIKDMSKVELASYSDLVDRFECLRCPNARWSDLDLDALGEQVVAELKKLYSLLDEQSLSEATGQSRQVDESTVYAVQIMLVFIGDPASAIDSLRSKLMAKKDLVLADRTTGLASAKAYRQLGLRRVDELRDKIGKPRTHSFSSLEVPFPLSPLVDEFLRTQRCEDGGTICPWTLMTTLLDCADVLSDGNVASRVLDVVAKIPTPTAVGVTTDTITFFHCIKRCRESPTVRVINLARRKDRLDAFLSQALREEVLCVLAVSHLSEEDNPHINEGEYFGSFAFDGAEGREAEAYKRLCQQVGGQPKLLSMVNMEWRPNDLKPFDRDAPSDEGLVRMTASEVGCALSHIASWKGSLRSLNLVSEKVPNEPSFFRHPRHMKRLFHVAGFAEGQALLSSNADMPPTAVCVILEDDAIMVDRFRDRLASLLKELPRDFHFCSIGYGRPKTAPIVPLTNQVGIPSHLFYLTGYIISRLGAEYLLQSLPVTGPVDSWIGLKMTSNWDNIWGTSIGVGSQSMPIAELPPRKELCRIMKFRAFCSLQPLCSQRVGVSSSMPAGRSWRQRDTDVDYSGGRSFLSSPS